MKSIKRNTYSYQFIHAAKKLTRMNFVCDQFS